MVERTGMVESWNWKEDARACGLELETVEYAKIQQTERTIHSMFQISRSFCLHDSELIWKKISLATANEIAWTPNSEEIAGLSVQWSWL